jgi:AAA domain
MADDVTKPRAKPDNLTARLDAWEMWEAMSEPERLAMILDRFPAEQWYAHDPATGDNVGTLAHFRADVPQWSAIKQRFKSIGGNPWDLEKSIDAYLGTQPNGKHAGKKSSLPPPETLTDLIAADIPPPIQLFDGLMHEGMLLFGGKSKRGKSWLMFDLAIALAVGRACFRHFLCEEPRPVLYLALEDGRARLQSRAKAIQPNLTTANAFHLRYNFPALEDGGIEILAEEIAQHHYGLVIIDVLAKLEKPKASKGDKNYHDIYEMFTPLQDLRKQYPFCLAMLTHLRKSEAEDVFDSLLGSVAYQGAQDVLWVLERKPKDDYAYLHIRDKDAEDKTIALRFLDGHWEYIGEGDEYEMSRDQRKILKILVEENAEMGIEQIRKAGEWKDDQYGYVRKLLVSMAKDDLIHHSSYGKYSATIRATKEMQALEAERDDDRIKW